MIRRTEYRGECEKKGWRKKNIDEEAKIRLQMEYILEEERKKMEDNRN